ncbi:hypothetical protein [Leptospira meyeri]|uniref:hypothetical protein n=1 Tax=Leptospira meyeri TaxID=29508 RepID=UPI001100E91D|nr:hypothetical protein [Leptospira meyeri]TGL10594.1 hypothetical protein EHQ50_16770 [Leptospira meyeri]
MTYQIPRLFGYLSQGNFETFRTNYWAQVTHPHGATSLYIWLWKGTENLPLLQIFSLYSFLVLSISSFHIMELTSVNANLKYFSLIANLFIVETLLISTTTQTDIIQTAIIFSSISLSLFVKRPLIYWNDSRIAIILGIMILLLTAIKETFALYSLSLIPFFLKHLWPTRLQLYSTKISIQNTFIIASIALLGFFFGYKDNFERYGSPFGPKKVLKEHTTVQDPIWISGFDNLLRFTSDILTFDGLPSQVFKETNRDLKKITSSILGTISNHYLLQRNLRAEFNSERQQRIHEDFSYGGIWGIILFLSSIVLLIKRPKRFPTIATLFLYSAFLYFVTNAFIGPYDPWRGRYFAGMFSLLMIPVSFFLFQTDKKKIWLTIITITLTIVSLYVINKREGREYLGQNSAFRNSFNSNSYANDADYKFIADLIYKKMEEKEKQLSVGICIPEDTPSLFLYKYDGFKENKVIAICDFEDGLSPHLLKTVDYTFFHENYLEKKPSDFALLRGFYLRKTIPR